MTRILLSLCVLAGLLAPATAQDATQEAKEKAKPAFEDGQAQVVEEFKSGWVRHFLWVETEFDCDGNGKKDRVHVDVTRPKQTDTEGLKVPVIYESSPYFAGIAGLAGRRYFWNPRHELGAKPPKRGTPPNIRHRGRHGMIAASLVRQWVPRGFAVVHSSAPGTGLSQGCVTVGGKIESLAPKAVIDWLNGRAKGYTTPGGNEEVKATWCTGKVGMTGTSYNGTIPVAAATTGVKGLEVIIPIAPNTSYYHYYRSNGLVRHPGGYMGEDIDVLYDFVNSGDPKRRGACDGKYRNKMLMAQLDRISGDYNDFWATRDLWPLFKNIKCAGLLAHAWNDWNVMPRHTVELHKAMKKKGLPVAVYFHQGGHGGPPPFEMMNKWFTRYLYGVENGVEKGPRSFIVREGKRRPTAYVDYPNPKATPVTLHLGKGGNKTGSLSLTKTNQQGTEMLTDDVSIRGAALAKAEESANRLLYVTPELKETVHISGTCRIKIRVASSTAAANLSVWMVSLPWEGAGGAGRRVMRRRGAPLTHNIITRGWADPQNYKSLDKSTPLKKDQFRELSFELEPDDQVIRIGQRIGLMIFSSDRDFTLWPPAGTMLTVDLDKTTIEIPVVGGTDALKKATEAK